MTQPIAPIARHVPQSDGARPSEDPEAHLKSLAVKLEASFLSEMLRHAKLGETEGPFSGGIGAAQFASFLREAQAPKSSKPSASKPVAN